MEIKKIFGLDDKYKDLSFYSSVFFRSGFIIESVNSVTDALNKIRVNKYTAYIFDIIVLPGDDDKWIELDKKKRKEHPHVDSYLGLELLQSLFVPEKANVQIDPYIKIEPERTIIFSVVSSELEELLSLGIPVAQILNKSDLEFNILLEVIKGIHTH